MKRKKIIMSSIFIIIAMALNIALAGNGKMVSVDVPLPTDIKIVAPGGGLPKEIGAFSGVWEGKCLRGMGDYEVALIVEEINLKEARVIYSSGKLEGGTLVIPPRVQRFKAKLISDKNQLEFQDGSQNYIFIMEKDLKHLMGTVEWRGHSDKIEMTKTR